MNPATFIRVLGPEQWKVGYIEPSRRPTDGRYGENPNRLEQHTQYQVILKPSPLNIQEIYLDSLRSFGIDPLAHDIRFVEDDWESPTLGASGLGWEVWLDGMEVTQFTYFQLAGSIELAPITVELTYGLERIAMYLQQVDNVYDLQWNKQVKYGDVHHQQEVEQSTYNFEIADVAMLLSLLGGSAEGDQRRAARFRCVVVLALPDGTEVVAEGTVSGRITTEPRGTAGFGYDPVFVPDEGDGRTFAEMTAVEKHAISHRGRALRALADRLAG